MWSLQSIAENIAKSLTNDMSAERLEWERMIASIPDPLAQEIEWKPMVRGGTSFKTHDIVLDTMNGNLEFRTSKGAKLFSVGFVGLWIFIDVMVGLSLFGSGSLTTAAIGPILIATVFTVVGLTSYHFFTKPIVFDRQNGYFYRGKPRMAYGIIDPNDRSMVPLSSIHAIQVTRERVRGRNTSFVSYEINLVLRDKTRVNVVDHGNLDVVRTDSKQLGEYLGVPVWGV